MLAIAPVNARQIVTGASPEGRAGSAVRGSLNGELGMVRVAVRWQSPPD